MILVWHQVNKVVLLVAVWCLKNRYKIRLVLQNRIKTERHAFVETVAKVESNGVLDNMIESVSIITVYFDQNVDLLTC